jgi:hypothetical protein
VVVPDTEKEVEERIQNPAGVVSGKILGGFNGDDNQPQNSGDPGFESVVAAIAQDYSKWSGSPTLARKMRTG